MKKSDFEGKIGSFFHVFNFNKQEFILELISIDDLPRHNPPANSKIADNIQIKENPFALTFLQYKNKSVDDDKFEKMEMYISPFKEDEKGIYYEAVFN